jgi:uncharacterized membrane protein YsdA (DUF1294 family)/cold shock CspA family protein
MSQRHAGKLVLWDDDRGYGFIESDGIRGRVFAHIRDFDRRAGRPMPGDDVTFHLVTGREGKPAAWQIELLSSRARPVTRSRPPRSGRRIIRILAAMMFAAAIVASIVLGAVTILYAVPYLVAGLVSFVLYASDKHYAQSGRPRLPEAVLHLVDVCFGIIGGLLAQGIVAHKSSKADFAMMTIFILASHIALLAGAVTGIFKLPF